VTASFLLNSEEYAKAWQEIARSHPTYVYGFLYSPRYIHTEPYSESFTVDFDKHYEIHTRLDSHAGTFVVWEKRTE